MIKKILSGLLLGFFVLLFQQCDNAHFQTYQYQNDSGASLLNIKSPQSDCEFIGADAMKTRLQDVLGISSGDVPVLDSNGNPTSSMRISSAATDLGDPDGSTGQFMDLSCSMTKFKTSIEVFADACADALSNPDIQNELFPNGDQNFDALYLSFVGRLPTDYETSQLQLLSNALPADKREAGACAATAASLEALIRI